MNLTYESLLKIGFVDGGFSLGRRQASHPAGLEWDEKDGLSFCDGGWWLPRVDTIEKLLLLIDLCSADYCVSCKKEPLGETPQFRDDRGPFAQLAWPFDRTTMTHRHASCVVDPGRL